MFTKLSFLFYRYFCNVTTSMEKMGETPENYLISMAKKYHETDKCMSKAWLLTATTLFQNNFAIQVSQMDGDIRHKCS